MIRRKVLLSLFAAMLATASVSGFLDRASGEVTGELLGKATVVYGTTRAVMAGLSFLEEVEFNVSVFVGTTISPFKVVKPINDFLDRFSNVLLLAITSLAVMKLMTFILGSTIVSWLYVGIAAWFIYAVIFTRQPSVPLKTWAPFRWFVAATVVRFSFVLIVGMNFMAHELFLAERQQLAEAELNRQAEVMDSITGEIANVARSDERSVPDAQPETTTRPPETSADSREKPQPPRFWWQRDSATPATDAADDDPGFFNRLGRALNPKQMLLRLQAQAEAFIDTVIDLTVLFLMQAVLIPLLFGFLLLRALPRLFDW
jgi:hypothetical protein